MEEGEAGRGLVRGEEEDRGGEMYGGKSTQL